MARVGTCGKWTSIRVSEDTKAQLEQLRELWQEMERPQWENALGSADVRSGRISNRDQIGLDQVVRKLLAIVLDHRARAREANAKKRV